MNAKHYSDRPLTVNIGRMQRTISASALYMSREPLEDHFYRIKDENQQLKRHYREAEDRVRSLSTKLTRLISEKKNLMTHEKGRRVIYLEEMIDDLSRKIEQLQRENMRLRDRNLLLQTKLSSKQGNHNLYSNIRSRTDSGLRQKRPAFEQRQVSSAKSALVQRSASTMSLNRVTFASETGGEVIFKSSSKPLEGEILKELQDEIHRLEDVILLQQTFIDSIQLEKNADLSMVKTSDTAAISDSRTVEVLREDNFDKLRHSRENKTAKEIIECLRKDLVEARAKTAQLEKQITCKSASELTIDQMKQKIENLESENRILRESFEKNLTACLEQVGGENDETERKLRSKLASLEKERQRLVSICEERERFIGDLKAKYDEIRSRYEELSVFVTSKGDMRPMETDYMRKNSDLAKQFLDIREMVDQFEQQLIDDE